MHTGEAEIRDGHYFGAALNRAARLRGLGSGGQTVVSSATVELVRDDLPSTCRLVDVGRYELKGFSRPEDVFLVVCAGGAEVDLGGFHVDVGLPVAATTFVGRDRESSAIEDLLRSGPLVTLTGPGGSGKTRLAVELATSLARRGEGSRIVAVDLAPMSDRAMVLSAMCGAVHVPVPPGRDGSEVAQVAAALARTGGIVILDNCEQVVDAVAEVVAELVRRPGSTKLLVTSQVPLGVAGESVYPLLGLGASVGDADAVRLFIERARSRDATFELEEGDLPFVEAICRRLDGMPFAIELAAAHAHLLSPGEIAARLTADPDAVLRSGAATASGRAESVRAAIDWSVGLLTAKERTLLRRLAVFEGGFTIEAAEAVCSGEGLEPGELYAALTSLVDRSLVARRRHGASARFWLLETIHHYAHEQLAASTPCAAASSTLTREGEVWALATSAGTALLKDAKGLRHLARLLERPGTDVHVLDLVAAERAPGQQVAVDAPLDIIDERARAEYKTRIRELQAEIDEALDANDLARVAASEDELDVLTQQLLGGTGLHGVRRHAGGTGERARVSVTKAVRQAIGRVAALSPEAGAHLERSIRTGTFCTYEPGGEPPIRIGL